MKNLFASLLLVISIVGFSQNINDKFEKWTVDDKAINITGIDISPDGKTVALVCGKKQGVILYDYKSKKILNEIKLDAGYLGYNVYYSALGNYLLVQERKVESSIKKAKKADYYVVDVEEGKVVQNFNKISDAKISNDEKYVVTLENSTVIYRAIKTGKKVKEFKPEDAMNAIALSPDGKDLAVVKKPTKSDIKMLASKNVSKKAIKAAAKTKHLITVYDMETFELKTLIPEFYDNINLLFYIENGDRLLSFNMAANSYINVALPKEDYKPTREGYLSRTSTQPDFSYSDNSKYFGIATMETFPSVNIYDVETASVVDKYDTKMKIWKNAKKGIYAGTNTSFVFLPGDKYILIAYGNSLIKWRYNKE
jgi:dipeptidyl aminopeptidase/acylaminoacyl peptidase